MGIKGKGIDFPVDDDHAHLEFLVQTWVEGVLEGEAMP